jgi:hypothetical protein
VPLDLQAATQSKEETGRERPPVSPLVRVPASTPGSLTPRVSVSVPARGTRVAGRPEVRADHALAADHSGAGSRRVLSVEPSAGLSVIAVAPDSSLRERSAASRLRSLRSPLRGLDPAVALPVRQAVVGAPAVQNAMRRAAFT